MTKVVWKGMRPPDHPIFKEGYSVGVQPPKQKQARQTPQNPARKPKKREE